MDSNNLSECSSNAKSLAERLDDDIDRFMDQLAANKQNSGQPKKEFNFEEWEKEIDSHPAFMKSLPKSGQMSEAMEALQAIKYDDTEEDPIVTAQSHKNEGNKHFKFKNYRWAVDCYTNGIKARCSDKALNAVLYANRAAANVRLGNTRSALRDCYAALKFDGSHVKAFLRGAECLLELRRPDECLLWMENDKTARELLHNIGNDGNNKEESNSVLLLKERALKAVKAKERDERKAKIKHPMVYLNQADQLLYWLLLLQYPEAGQTDFVKDCCEASTLREILSCGPLSQPPPWDQQQQCHYTMDNVLVFVEQQRHGDAMDTVLEIPLETTLRDLVASEGFAVKHGLVTVMICAKQYVEKNMQLVSKVDRTWRLM